MSSVTATVILARMGSHRLPGKALLPLGDRPMLERLIERIRPARWAHRLILATTTGSEDDVLIALAQRLGIESFRGDPQDVLARLSHATGSLGLDQLVLLLGDNPLLHADLVDAVTDFYVDGNWDYAATVTKEYPHAPATSRRFALGLRVQVLSRESIEQAHRLARLPFHREHATTFMLDHPELFRVGYYEARGPWETLHRPDWTFAVNVRKNFEMVQALFDRCAGQGPHFSIQQALRIFEGSPHLHSLMGEHEAVAQL